MTDPWPRHRCYCHRHHHRHRHQLTPTGRGASSRPASPPLLSPRLPRPASHEDGPIFSSGLRCGPYIDREGLGGRPGSQCRAPPSAVLFGSVLSYPSLLYSAASLLETTISLCIATENILLKRPRNNALCHAERKILEK